ncbi:MAG: mechanosensitive ion channel family protein [Sulfurovaceae bacterium]|nr:mechanosensitive ion channel family protein [Sulfurovaceae bacterium]MDD5549546.1 mechanosensitive ion channel family protein [Sulfurovaceae bacterium]
MPTNELNATVQLIAINDIDKNFAITIQTQLAPIYNKFPFLANAIWHIPLGNLIAAIVVFLFFLFLRKFFTFIIIGSLQKLAKYTETYYDDKILHALKAPTSFAFIIVGFHLFFMLIFKETQTIKNILNALIIYDIFWVIIAITNALEGVVYHAVEKLNPDLSKEVGNFILTLLKILMGAVGLGFILQIWGINVTALIASLGLGGLAFAFAAKDIAANLFGSFSLLLDKTIRIGEWIKVDGVEGEVEDIGIRVTKIRSFEKSLITVPNQIVANQPIENFSRRGVRRIQMSIGLTYGSSSEQMKNVLQEIKSMLKKHKGIAHDEKLLVNFDSFGDSALNIFIYTFTNTPNWDKYLDIREDINLQIMKIVEKNNCAFAFPTQSIYIENMPKKGLEE